MTKRISKDEFVRRLATRMSVAPDVAERWMDGVIETIYDSLKAGESITLNGLGGFYVRRERDSWVFKFNPAQRLRALFGWSSSYKGEL
jgi:DNA-binding protein HU-beta